MSWILVNTGLGNGLLPDGSKPLPKPVLTYQQVSFTYDQFYKKCS